MISSNQISAKIIEAINQSGLTQTELAKRLQINQSAVGQYLSGRALPSLETFVKLCSILDLDANDILCISDYKPE